MRALFIALMIALLPLRGWVGDAMAQAAVAPQVQAAAHEQTAHHDCGLHTASGDAAQGEAADQGDGCTLCQACHTLALEAPTARSAIQDPVRILACIATPDFASADRAPSVKPPIG